MAQGRKTKIKKIFGGAAGVSRRCHPLGLISFILGLTACQMPAAITTEKSVVEPEPAPVATAPAPNPLSASNLIGLTQERIAEVFGQPRQVRRESPAEVWQYSSAHCVVDFYLYRVQGGGLSVSFIEARDAAAMATEADHCFQTLTQRAAL